MYKYACQWRCVYVYTHVQTHIYGETAPTSKQHRPHGRFRPPCRPHEWTASGTRLRLPPRGGRESPQPTTFLAGAGVGSRKPALRTCGAWVGSGRRRRGLSRSGSLWTEQRGGQSPRSREPVHTPAHASGAHGQLMERGVPWWRDPC